jgi:phosphate transport system protein
MEERYPRIFFQKRLKDLKTDVEKLGDMTLQTLKNAIVAFKDYDEELVKEVIKSGKKIDKMSFYLERRCISIIASEQPVARDLRFIEACIKVGSHLKRMGNLAVNIAEAARNLKDEEVPPKPKNDLIHMADIVELMVSKCMAAFLNQDMNIARELSHDDDKVDDLFDTALEHITSSMFQDKEAISSLMYLLFVARFLERTADRAVSIGHRTIFMITCERP